MDKSKLEERASFVVKGNVISVSLRPYRGLVVSSVHVIESEGEYAVQIQGELLEKDWPKVLLLAKFNEELFSSIEKDQIVEGHAMCVIRALDQDQAEGIKETLEKASDLE